jgi:hypothetical protein
MQSEYNKDREVIAAATESTEKCPECSAVAREAADFDRDMACGGTGTFGIWTDSYEAAVQEHGCGRTIAVIEAARQTKAQRDARARVRWPAALDEIESLREENRRLQCQLDDLEDALDGGRYGRGCS